MVPPVGNALERAAAQSVNQVRSGLKMVPVHHYGPFALVAKPVQVILLRHECPFHHVLVPGMLTEKPCSALSAVPSKSIKVLTVSCSSM